jgi:hypothetical protein
MEYMKRSFSQSLLLFSIPLIFLITGCEEKKAPIEPKNHKPKIESISAKPAALLINTAATLTCIAVDEDNDKVSVSWSSKRGTFFKSNIGAVVKWISPSTAGIDTIFVAVNDGKEIVHGMVLITVGILPSVPVPLKPANNTDEISLTVPLNWRNAKGGDNYDLQVSADRVFSRLWFIKAGLKKITQKIGGLNSNTIYYWRIRSRNIFGKSKWSSVFSFKTVGPPKIPKILSPSDSAKIISVTPTLSWSKLDNAKSYTIQISNSNSFSNLVFNQSSLTDTNSKVSELNYFTTYFWRVKAENIYGSSEWSEVATFSTTGTKPEVPTLLTPLNEATDTPLSQILSWEGSSYAVDYTIQSSEDSSFSNLVYNQNGYTKKKFLLSGLSDSKKYYWRIKANNDYGSSDWSDTRSFTTLLSAPILSEPLNGAIDVSPSPSFSWNPIAAAKSYSMQISADSTFTNLIKNLNGLISVNEQISGLSSFTKYFWRVKAENDITESSWSEISSLTVSSYYYKGLPYGNQAIFNPIYTLLSGGFDMIQVGNRRDIINFPYNIALKNIWKNLSDPFASINEYGWWNFINDQVLPLSLNKKNAQFWPNYTLHLIGGGMEYAALKEWYEYHHYPSPSMLSALTVMSYHFINEVTENGTYVGGDVDPIADIYIFDIGGIILFTSESVKKFFSE